jgi:protein-tyrosine phosphatase
MPESPARNLNLTGATNFRDLGGYPTVDGRAVRWRQIFRSNHLGNLTDEDIAVLNGLGLKTAFDFRGAEERLPFMCRHDGITVHSLAIEPVTTVALRERLAALGRLSSEMTREIMQDSYRNYVRGNSDSFRKLFAHLIEDRAPLVIHCTAGKDRTGFASALILRALGVAEDVILEDYLLTNRFYKIDPAAIGIDLPDEARQVLGQVEAKFLDAAFGAVDADYGDLTTYFTERLGVGPREISELKSRYLDG